MKISVALAAYKGEKYIGSQLDSILAQLPADGEIIVSDDLPGGETEKIVSAFAEKDPRVKYIHGPGNGVTANFENALRSCTGDIIFLCDQDDVWLSGKVKAVTDEINDGACLVLHDACVTDSELNPVEDSFFLVHSSRTGLVPNLIRNSFVGCCMAFRRELLETVLPFPDNLPMHDWWIALAAMKKHKPVSLLNMPLIKWRRHEGTVTGGKNSLALQIRWRLTMLKLLRNI